MIDAPLPRSVAQDFGRSRRCRWTTADGTAGLFYEVSITNNCSSDLMSQPAILPANSGETVVKSSDKLWAIFLARVQEMP